MEVNEKDQHMCVRKQGATWRAGGKRDSSSPVSSNGHQVSWCCSWHDGFAFAYEHALFRNNSWQRALRRHSSGSCNSGFPVKSQTRNQHQLIISSCWRSQGLIFTLSANETAVLCSGSAQGKLGKLWQLGGLFFGSGEKTKLRTSRCWEGLGQEEKGMTEDEMAGWYRRLDGHEFG